MKTPRSQRTPQPFAGLPRQPDCSVCEPEAGLHPAAAPSASLSRPACSCPAAIAATSIPLDIAARRPLGRIAAGLVCLGDHGSFLETLGTPFHGQQVEPGKLGWAMAALTAGLGMRAVARVFAPDPNSVLGWLVEAADMCKRCGTVRQSVSTGRVVTPVRKMRDTGHGTGPK